MVAECETGFSRKLDSTGRIRVITNGVVEISASADDVSAATITLSAGIVRASGAIECDALIANSVAATSYTPGKGNVE